MQGDDVQIRQRQRRIVGHEAGSFHRLIGPEEMPATVSGVNRSPVVTPGTL